ncbi:MAG: single-stranded-DNA-specific exonuclease RecJ [Candidatus Marinimicrobia bacterium]|nr:single-stranded-DNA-specific exonuclease RecJ [Candidatus Neomarinimicrobiota bacterium]
MKWVYPEISGDDVLEYSKQFRLSYLFTKVLLNRGIRSKEAMQRYIDKSAYSLYDPFSMLDMDKAIGILKAALENEKKIMIYGDYDVDGVTSASILYLFLRTLTDTVYYYIPEREKEGYGLSCEGIDYAIERDIDLIITCDCGITAEEEVAYARGKGIELIITDHHEQAGTLPPASAILNPKRREDRYPFRDLCGAGVVFKLVEAYCIRHYGTSEKARQYLDLVAIGTAADIVPLKDENRCMVREGLERIRNRECRLGILELFNVCKMDTAKISVVNIVFGLAPRLNAVGRMGSASRAIILLTADDRRIARQYSIILNQENEERQKVECRVTAEAVKQVHTKYGENIPKALVLSGNWHPGVIGIVSSKIKDKFNRPVFLIATKDGEGKGSGRSINDVDLYAALTHCNKYLSGYGGHQMAAGLTIEEENIPDFEKEFLEYADEHILPDMLKPVIYVDADLEPAEINTRLMDFLHDMEPFGPGNMRPKFSLRNVRASNSVLLKDKHLKFNIREDGHSLQCIGWNMLNQFELVMDTSQRVDIAFVPTVNEWNGIKRIQLVIKDIRPHIV